MKILNCARSGKSDKKVGNSCATVRKDGKAPGSDESEDLPGAYTIFEVGVDFQNV